MLGLFGTLSMATRSLQAQQTAIEVAGQNIANVNNTAYARQRVNLATSPTVQTNVGPQGTGVQVTGIQSIRSALLDNQVQGELSVGSYWTSQQGALESTQTGLGEFIDSTTGTATSTDGATDGLSDDINGLFSGFEAVSTSPESTANRQLLLNNAQTLATRLNQTSANLADVKASLNTSLQGNVTDANQLLSDIANLNKQISAAEAPGGNPANDLRDLRESKLETLAGLVNVTTSTGDAGAMNISIGGTQLVSDSNVLDTMQTYDAGGGQMLIRTTTGGTPLTLSGGQMQGTIDARDGTLAGLQTSLDTLASQLITQVNAVHDSGYGLNGTTGAKFFTGSDASDIGVNSALVDDPTLVQAAGAPGAPGDNTVAFALGQMATAPQAGLNNQSFSDSYSQTVAGLGYALSNANTQSADSSKVQDLLTQQRDSVSGVSIDEEMTDLIGFQRAYAASAKMVSTVEDMLDTVLNMVH
ncbi:MAG TPA: flagellar hook-associated protein FlgK [Verrucomicrobiae bacterium]|nr:flagellar hook-associated protein FlgK [Verrucomicrobiae bacterium]